MTHTEGYFPSTTFDNISWPYLVKPPGYEASAAQTDREDRISITLYPYLKPSRQNPSR